MIEFVELTSMENTEMISSSIRLACSDVARAISGVVDADDGKVILYVWMIPAMPVVCKVYWDD